MVKLITYYPNGQPYIVEDRINGIRDEVEIYNVDGQKINTIDYYNGQIYYIRYWKNGILQNLHGPAVMSWYDNGQIYRILHHQNNRLRGTESICWYDNDKINYIKYCQNDLLHNLHGPAFMAWSSTDENKVIKYCHFGRLIKKYEF